MILNKVSIVIRNKNEAAYLETTLKILTELYAEDVYEIILIDNESTDGSVEVARRYGCIVHEITDFTYGKAINMGIQKASSNYVLLLSSHAVPIGQGFFSNSINYMALNPKTAGIRFVNSISNYKRALENNLKVKEPLKFGLMAGCCLVNKIVWKEIKFDEKLAFSEDKEWSLRVMNAGYEIADLNESFFYFINRSRKSLINRYRNETLEEYRLHQKKFPSRIHLVGSFIKAAFIKNSGRFIEKIGYEYEILKVKLYIRKKLIIEGKS